MIFVFYFFAAVLVWLSFKSFRGGIGYLRFFRSELAKPPSNFTPFATIIAPCRGIDDGMQENLAALFEQDYPEYEMIFVVDDAADEVVAVINELIHHRDTEARNKEEGEKGRKGEREQDRISVRSASLRLGNEDPVKSKLIIAPKALDSSQKVENLREAVLHADPRSQVFAFVDSDARSAKNWLRSLVAPLEDAGVGAATGYRWFIAKRPTFATELNSVWNASIASALGANTKTNFCWGGSMAIRRDIFERVEMREKWRGTLSDDFTVARAMTEAKLPIVFVPQALTASFEDPTFTEMLEFTTRQMKITRVYAPKLWLMSFVGSALFCSVMIAALLIIGFSERNEIAVGAATGTLILVITFSLGKAYLRLKAVRLVLPDRKAELRRQTLSQLTLVLLAPAIFFYNSFAAWLSRRVTWRGITYELKSQCETVIIAD